MVRFPFRAEPLLAGNCLPCGHPVKGAPLRSAFLRNGCAALDRGPAYGKKLRNIKRFGCRVFAPIAMTDSRTTIRTPVL